MGSRESQTAGIFAERDYLAPRSDYTYRGYQAREDQGGPNWLWLSAGTLLVVAGAYLIYESLSSQGTTERPERKLARGKGIQVNERITVEKPVGEIYGYWRELENLPHIMSHLESVKNLGAGRSHWVAKAPAGAKVEWDAEITREHPNELISWRSAEDADVPNEGTVRFRARGNATEIDVSLRYLLPGGALGAAVAKLFGEEPSQQIGDDLQHFKEGVEAGQITTST